MNLFRWLLLPATAALAACAGVPADRGMQDVQKLVADRSAISIQTPGSAEASSQLRELLAQPLSVDSATNIALLRNPAMQSLYARLGISEADVLEASRLSNPTLSVSGLVPNHGGPVRIGYGLMQNFTDLLFLHTRTGIAKEERTRGEEMAAREIQNLTADVAAAWYELVAARQVAAMRKVSAKAETTAAQLAQRFFAAGNISELDLLVRQSAATKAELQADGAEAQASVARSRLTQLMGLSSSEANWQTAEQLPLPVGKEDDITSLQEIGRKSRLDLQAKQREVKTLQTVHELAQRLRWLGVIDVGVQGERDNDGTHLIGPAISLQLPIFHQGQASILRTQSQLEQSQAELSSLQTEVDNSIVAACTKLAEARARSERYRKERIPQSEHIVARTQEYVNYMLVGAFDLIRAQQDEYDAYQGYLESLRDYWLARVDLSRAIGARLPSDEQIGSAGAAATEIPSASPSDGMAGMEHGAHDMKHMQEDKSGETPKAVNEPRK